MKLISSRLRVELRRARGSFVLLTIGVAAGVAAAGVMISKENVHLPWQGSYTVHIAVSNATGVVAGLDEVRWAGIVVGRISGVQFESGHPVLTAQMSTGDIGGARLYTDAEVQLRPQTPLSDMYLDVVSRGHRAAGLLGPNQVLQASQTQTPVDVADVLNTFSEPVRSRLQELLDELATGLSPAGGQQLRTAFVEATSLLEAQKKLSGTLATRQMLVEDVVHDSKLLFSELGDQGTDLDRLVRNGSSTLQALGEESPALSEMISELPSTLTQLRTSFGQLQSTLGVVRPALTDLIPTADALPSGLTALKNFSDAASPALKSLEPAVSALDPLARNLAPTARALDGAFSKLAPQAPDLNYITGKVVPCELPVDKFFAWTLSVLKYGNADNHTSSPRGVLVTGPFEDLQKDPTLTKVIGCADGQPAPGAILADK